MGIVGSESSVFSHQSSARLRKPICDGGLSTNREPDDRRSDDEQSMTNDSLKPPKPLHRTADTHSRNPMPTFFSCPRPALRSVRVRSARRNQLKGDVLPFGSFPVGFRPPPGARTTREGSC